MSERPQIDPGETPTSSEAVKKNRSNAMVVLGLLMFVVAGMVRTTNPDGGVTGVLLFGIFGVALIVGGLVIRP